MNITCTTIQFVILKRCMYIVQTVFVIKTNIYCKTTTTMTQKNKTIMVKAHFEERKNK